jgi:hypothetical protein
MNYEEAQEQGLTGILWDLKGRYMHPIGWRYRKARVTEICNVANWVTDDALEKDRERFKLSREKEEYNMKLAKGKRGH